MEALKATDIKLQRFSRITMRTSSPPVHVHINDATPLHVYVKSSTRSPQGRPFVHSTRPTVRVRSRLPWIPPGKAPTLYWGGPTHRLEISPPLPEAEPQGSQSELRLHELRSAEEESLNGRIRKYERTVDGLMTEVGALKNEKMALRRKQQEEQEEEELSVSQRVMEEQQEEEPAEVNEELQHSEEENLRLRQSMEKMMEENPRRSEEVLLRLLEQVEADGEEATKHVSALRHSVSKQMTGSVSESEVFSRHKKLLLQKLQMFEQSNKTLRRLLSHTQDLQVEEQKEELMRRLLDTEAEKEMLVEKLQHKDRETSELNTQLEAEKLRAQTCWSRSRGAEWTRGHLQGELRRRDAENGRLSVQMKNLQQAANRSRAQRDQLTAEVSGLRRRLTADGDALKRLTRSHKHKQDANAKLRLQLMDTEQQIREAVMSSDTWRSRHSQEVQEKKKLEAELSLLSSRVEELRRQQREEEQRSRAEKEELQEQLLQVSTGSSSAHNTSLKVAVASSEEKLSVCQSELQQVKDTVTQYQNLLDSYKTQIQETGAEAEEVRSRLEEAERGGAAVRQQLQQEVEEVREQLRRRTEELQPLPEALRRSQAQLQEAQEKERRQDRRSSELRSSLTELSRKVESQSSHMELSRQKNKLLLEENLQLQQQVVALERKLQDSRAQSGELLSQLAAREEAVCSHQRLLEEKNTECSSLSRRLKEALGDAHQQMIDSRERAAAKQRSTQETILELETKLSRTSSQISQLLHNKELAERRYQTRLQDVKDQLKQSDCTNRSLQNYVHFLKTSYANVYQDVAPGAALRVPSPL